MQITIDGILIEVQRKKIKRSYLRFRADGTVLATVPLKADLRVIEEYVVKNLLRMKQKQAEAIQRAKESNPTYTTGETVYLFGVPYRLHVRRAERNCVKLENRELVLEVKNGTSREAREKLLNEFYRENLKKAIDARLPLWEATTGLSCSSYQTKNMKTRWGTCNTRTKKIWLNLQLAKKPLECLDYVLLHELAHLRVPNHSKEFWAFVSLYMPDWSERKSKL